jgi:hypothetical protein
MIDSTSPPTVQEKGRVARPLQDLLAKNQAGWIWWLPGLQVLRHYQRAWVDWEDRIVGAVPGRAQNGPAEESLGTPGQTL